MTERMDRALDCWPEGVPDWIEALVMACDAASQQQVAKRIGVSSTMVSQAISNSYTAPLTTLESRVRAIFLTGDVTCPGLGRIRSEDCLGWRDRARSPGPLNPSRARMRRACNRCPIFKGEKND